MIFQSSIRFRTALALSLLMATLWAAAAAVTTARLSGELDEVFDAALRQTGQRILELAVVDILSREEEGLTQHIMALDAENEYFAYIVRDAQGRVLLRSQQADPTMFPPFDRNGFFETENFRFYNEEAVLGTVIMTIAEPLSHRRQALREVAMNLALPVIAVIPLSILAIVFGIGFGLRPLGRLRENLSQRHANDLAHLDLTGLPGEVRPVAETVNQLFDRLGGAIEAERSFASNAAHELRTPLAGAIAQAQLLRNNTDDDDTKKRAEGIENTLKRLTQMSEKLIQLARAEGAKMKADAPHDVRRVLQLVIGDFPKTDQDRVNLQIPETAVMSEIDPDIAAIVIRNLVENALRHGHGGPISVALQPTGSLVVENACDTVPADALKSLQNRFSRGDRAGVGSGLGLAIVQKVAERTGADLQLASPIPGQDRGFRVTIMLA